MNVRGDTIGMYVYTCMDMFGRYNSNELPIAHRWQVEIVSSSV